ncbi:hypothetical protein [Cupriavidus necator]
MEIGRWEQMSEAERAQVLAAAPARRGQRAATGALS